MTRTTLFLSVLLSGGFLPGAPALAQSAAGGSAIFSNAASVAMGSQGSLAMLAHSPGLRVAFRHRLPQRHSMTQAGVAPHAQIIALPADDADDGTAMPTAQDLATALNLH